MIRLFCSLALCISFAMNGKAQTTPAKSAGRATNNPPQQVHPILPPAHPLRAEELTADVTQFSFIVYGDTRGRRDGKEIQYEHSLVVDSMLETIKKLETSKYPVRFVLQTGDAVVDGNKTEQWNTSFVEVINRLTQKGGVPYFLAPGNHDVTSAKDLNDQKRHNGLTNYLNAVSKLIPTDGKMRRLDGYPTYAFGFGNSFFMALDSNIANDPTQNAWLTNQLQSLDRTRYQNVFAFFHHPAFSSGPHGGNNVEAPTAEIRKRWMPLFRQHKVRAIFCGHEHFFEHWVERYQDSDGVERRMDEILTGGGGAPLYGYKGEPATNNYLTNQVNAGVKLEHLVAPGLKPGDNPYHYVVVRVDGTELNMQVIGVDWGGGFQPYKSNKADLN